MATSDVPPGLFQLAALVKQGLGNKVDAGAPGFFDLLADDVVMEFPFMPPGRPKGLIGRAAAIDYMGGAATTLAIDTMTLDATHQTVNPDITILEFRVDGRSVKTGRPYNQTYVVVITVRDGLIRRYKSYYNPLLVMDIASDSRQ